ncbi:MAG: peroxiredoxin [Gammaproteobacteria bacterium]|nr:peroxiredoxin [Gammaproteobacteria bacterium]MCH9743795.1 peroxiredoxin [Gammaproteobacteria bacterium]
MTITEKNLTLPQFAFETTAGSMTFSDLKGQYIVLYFYPKDSTPGCTQESKDFRDLLGKFKKVNAVILGISRDNINSHHKFIDKFDLPFALISDPDEKLCNHFDVMKMKSMFGKKYRGIERSTFLIDPNGKIIQEWRKVKVTGHAEEVLDTILPS